MSNYYKQDIDILNISTKTKNNLRYYGIKTIQDLADADLMNNVKFSFISFSLRRKILDSVKEMQRSLHSM